LKINILINENKKWLIKNYSTKAVFCSCSNLDMPAYL